MSENGSLVSRAEMKAHLDPMREDIREIKQDVKTLIIAQVGAQAIQSAKKDKGARKIAWGGLIVAGLSALTWAQPAVAKLFH